MLILTLQVVLSVLGFMYKSPAFLGNNEVNTKYEIAWKDSLDVVAAMAKDAKMTEILTASDLKKLQGVASYYDRIDSPLVLLSLLEEVLRVPKVESIVKLYPEYELVLSATKDLVSTITEKFRLPEMTQENWKELLLKIKLETTAKDPNYQSTTDCAAICEKQIINDEKYLDLMTADNSLRKMLSDLIPKTTEDALRSLQMGILLRLPDLSQRSSKFLQNVLSMDNVVKIFQASFKTEMIELKRKAEQYFLWEFDDIAKNDTRFLSLKLDELFYFLVSGEVNVPNEYSIFEAIERWVTFDLATRKEHVATLMTTVRLYLCTISELNRILDHHLLAGLDSVQKSIRSAIYLIGTNVEKLPDLIKKQQRHLHETLFVIGGETSTHRSLSVETFSTSKKQWIYHENLNYGARTRTSTVVVGKTIIVFAHSQYNVSSLDPIKKEWRTLSKVPNGRIYYAVAEHNGLIYVLGGMMNNILTKVCEIFNPKSGAWTGMAHLDTNIWHAAAATLNGKIYLAGGKDDSDEIGTVQAFDPKSNKWTVMASLNYIRSEPSLISDGDYLWAFGGFGNGYLSSIERYDSEIGVWTIMPEMSFKRGALQAVYFSGSFFVMGGNADTGISSKVEVYNPRRKTWTKSSDLHFGRYFLGACVVQDLSNAYDYI